MNTVITQGLFNHSPTALKVAVLMGGISEEREISLITASKIITNLEEMGYNVVAMDVGSDLANALTIEKPDLVFNAMHGKWGEDGSIPGLLDIMGIPYTHSGILASAIGFDKIYSQIIFASYGIKCPKRIVMQKGDDLSKEPMKRPFVIKPRSSGSSVGVEIIFEEDDYDFSKYPFLHGDTILIEEFIPGREIQVAIVGDKAIGTLEISLKNKRFYDYEAKYVDGVVDHLCPAPLNAEAERKLLNIAEKVHHSIGCKSISRVEFRYNEAGDGEFYLIEINTHPGMTPLSIVPEIAAYHGINFKSLLKILIDDALKK